MRLWGGWVGLGRGEVGGLNLSGLGVDGLGEMVGGRPMVAGVFRSGVVFALVYVAASAALFVGSRSGFVVLLVLSQLVAVRMFVARGARVSGAGVWMSVSGSARLWGAWSAGRGLVWLCRFWAVRGRLVAWRRSPGSRRCCRMGWLTVTRSVLSLSMGRSSRRWRRGGRLLIRAWSW